MKKAVLICLFLAAAFFSFSPLEARERSVVNVSNTEILSEGLYFKVCSCSLMKSKNQVAVTVEAKNKSLLSQALYVELCDSKNNRYAPKEQNSEIFKPLRLNKTVTQKLTFEIPKAEMNAKSFKLCLYSRDIFKKSKKTLITKLTVKP